MIRDMNITACFSGAMKKGIAGQLGQIFGSNDQLTEEEKNVLEDTMYAMKSDAELGLDQELVIAVWATKLIGVIEFLSACGRIDESQEEALHMMVNEIEAGR